MNKKPINYKKINIVMSIIYIFYRKNKEKKIGIIKMKRIRNTESKHGLFFLIKKSNTSYPSTPT